MPGPDHPDSNQPPPNPPRVVYPFATVRHQFPGAIIARLSQALGFHLRKAEYCLRKGAAY